MRRYILLGGAACVSAILLAAVFTPWKSGADYEHADREEAERMFTDAIRSDGAVAAYEAFVSAMDGVPADKQHVLAHVFGKALYAVDGLEAFAVCDERFLYGCFHEVMGRIISDSGLSVIPAVFERCTHTSTPRPFACLHGIGHGIIASVGYTSAGLGEALSACEQFSPAALSFWCYSGVFMEYNQQSMLGTEYVREAESGAHSAYEPCISVEESYAPACVFEQVPWWHRVLFDGDASEETFDALGALCEGLGMGARLERICFEGIGNITTPSVGYDPYRALRLCEAASAEALPRLFCISMAAQSLSQGARDAEAAESVCAELSEVSREYCMAYVRKEATIVRPRPAPNL